MTRIVIDAATQAKLQHLSGVVELCDAAGQVLGQFVPAPDVPKLGPLVPQISVEELRRREQANEKRYTTAEVIAHLEKL